MRKLAQRRIRSALGLGLAALVAAQAGCSAWGGQDTGVQEFQRVEPVTRSRYYLYVPGDYSSERAWPLVVTLHGARARDSAKAQVRQWKALAEKHGFIVLAPSLESPGGILPVSRSARRAALDKDEKRVLAGIDDVKGRYRIDARAVMITGYAAGGYPLYYIALRNPGLFNAVAAGMCRFDRELVKAVPVTEAVRRTPVLIYFGKASHPVHSKWSRVASDSWAAFRYLRESRCFKAEIDDVRGGNQRRPDVAYSFWKKHLPGRP